MARLLLLLVAGVAAYGQNIIPIGTTPKATAEEYPLHAIVARDDIGAEYMVHSFSEGEQMFIAENYLVVEVALFPPKGESVGVEVGKFALRVNGKKAMLMAQNPSMVAASLQHRDWQTPRGPVADLGLGGINVGLGRPRTQAPFPGGSDPNRLPNPPRAPDGDSPVPPKEVVKPEELLMQTALPDGPHHGAVSGFLYFAWQGKASAIKSIDLLYDGVTLKMR